jgi:hypothetical protein
MALCKNRVRSAEAQTGKWSLSRQPNKAEHHQRTQSGLDLTWISALCRCGRHWLEKHFSSCSSPGGWQSSLSGLRPHGKHCAGDWPAFLPCRDLGSHFCLLFLVSCLLGPFSLQDYRGEGDSRASPWRDRASVWKPDGSLWGTFKRVTGEQSELI